MLVPEGDIVSATYKDGTTEVLYTSDAKEENLPMVVVLINQKSRQCRRAVRPGPQGL